MAITAKVSSSFEKDKAKFMANHAKAVNKSLVKTGAKLLELCQPYIPVETGEMKRSGFVRLEKAGEKAQVAVGFKTNYAIYVHEDLDKAHGDVYNFIYAEDIAAGRKNAKGPDEQAKFLTQPAEDNAKLLQSILAEGINT